MGTCIGALIFCSLAPPVRSVSLDTPKMHLLPSASDGTFAGAVFLRSPATPVHLEQADGDPSRRIASGLPSSIQHGTMAIAIAGLTGLFSSRFLNYFLHRSFACTSLLARTHL
jgi:hypothetical protein